jgi:hypothetical protein
MRRGQRPIRRVVDRLLAGAVEKALPDLGNVRGAVHDIGQQVAAMREAQTLGAGAATPLPRPPQWASAPFGPGSPLYPAPLDPVRPDSGRPAPRLYEYPVSWNLTGTANRLHSWQLLRDAADGCEPVPPLHRDPQGSHGGLDWDIVISQGAIETAQRDEGPGTGRADLEASSATGCPGDRPGRAFLGEPDRANGYSFAQWLSMLLEEVFVLDAAAIYPRRTYGGDLWSLEVLDGSTIKPLLDERGGRPLRPRRRSSRSSTASPAASSPPTSARRGRRRGHRRRLRLRPAHLQPPRGAGVDAVRVQRG